MNSKLEVFKQRLRTIQNETHTNNFIVAFSGGKDSSVLLHLTAIFCIQEGLSLTVLHGDTLVENPLIRDYCNGFLTKLGLWWNEVRIIITTPRPDMTFWVNVIGKGYPMPNFRFRWCQKHLKIKPAQRVLKKEQGVLLVGMRASESIERKRSMNRRFLNDTELKSNDEIRVFAPMYDWTDADVWSFLRNNQLPWGEDYSKLLALYEEAKGESRSIPRFGCWVCSVVRKDKTMRNLAKKNKKLELLVNFRDWLVDFCSRPENRSGFTRRGRPVKKGKGTLTFSARQEIFHRLTDLQNNFHSIQLIKKWEIEVIRKVWENEEISFIPKINLEKEQCLPIEVLPIEIILNPTPSTCLKLSNVIDTRLKSAL